MESNWRLNVARYGMTGWLPTLAGNEVTLCARILGENILLTNAHEVGAALTTAVGIPIGEDTFINGYDQQPMFTGRFPYGWDVEPDQ